MQLSLFYNYCISFIKICKLAKISKDANDFMINIIQYGMESCFKKFVQCALLLFLKRTIFTFSENEENKQLIKIGRAHV